MNNLQEFIQQLIKRKECVTIDAPVNLDLELAEIHRRVIAAGGPALLFTNVHNNGKISPFPVVSNLFGTKSRVDLAFGSGPEKIIRDITSIIKEKPNLATLWRNKKTLLALRSIGTKNIKDSKLIQASDKISLADLPFTKSWDQDGGFFATLPLVYTENPEDHGHNLGMYRMQRFNDWQTGIHWQIHKGGGFHYHQAEKENIALPVNVFFGGPPALILSAIAPLPENVEELLLAGLVHGKKISLLKKKDIPLPLIAEAEFVLSGEVKARVRKGEGPFGDHYGYYSLKHPYPVFNVKKIFHKKNAIFPVTVVGKPKQEDFFLGDYLQKLLSPIFPFVMPGVLDLWSYGETGYHSLSACIVKERYPREAMASAFAILGQGQLSLTKFLLVLDKEMDLENFKAVLSYILQRADFSRDLYIFDQLSMDTLDYTGPQINKGSKGILLGMGKPIRKLSSKIQKLPSWVNKASVYTPGCLVISTGKSFKQERLTPDKMVKSKEFVHWPLIVLVDDADIATKTSSRFLWTMFTRFEPAADIYSHDKKINRNTLSFNEPILFDCRMKPPYPEELFCLPGIQETVDQRWKEYFPQGQDMGDSDNAHLDLK